MPPRRRCAPATRRARPPISATRCCATIPPSSPLSPPPWRSASAARVTADRIVTELARIAFADIRSFADWGQGGVDLGLRAAAELSPDDTAAIAEIYGPGKAGGRPKLKLHDKRAALELLARHVGMIGPRRESPAPREFGPELPAREVLRRKLAAMAGEKEGDGGAPPHPPSPPLRRGEGGTCVAGG